MDEGLLASPEGRVYPIVRGVPRLLQGALSLFPAFRARREADLRRLGLWTDAALAPPPEEFRRLVEPTLRRFEREWRSHDLAGRTWGLDQPTRIGHFLRYVGLSREDVLGKRVLDAGAGTGQLTCSIATLGCETVGIDLSPAVERGWMARTRLAGEAARRVHVVQGDLLVPPLREHAFDVVHSSGVLHHTPDTRRAFESVARLVAPGGALGVWLYRPQPEDYLPLVPFVRPPTLALPVSRLRRVTPRMPPRLLWSLLYVHTAAFHAAYAVNRVVRGRPHDQTVRERVTSLFDTLAPPFVWRHEPEDVASWFAALGFEDVEDTSLPGDSGGSNVRGRRPGARPSDPLVAA